MVLPGYVSVEQRQEHLAELFLTNVTVKDLGVHPHRPLGDSRSLNPLLEGRVRAEEEIFGAWI